MGGRQLILLDYIINLSIFSLLVSTPLVVRSFIKHKPLKRYRLGVGVYAGIVSFALVMLSIQQQGYSYDIRYAPVILVFAYLGPTAGLITGGFGLFARLLTSGNWDTAIMGWSIIMIGFSIIHLYISHLTPVKKSIAFFGSYILIYVINVPIIFNVFRDKPFFHLQYLLFVMLGVIIGGLLIESYQKLYRLNTKLSDTFKIVETTQQELKHTLEEINGGIFKFKKSEDSYIHTFAEGKFFHQGEEQSQDSIGRKPIQELLPYSFLQSVLPYYENAWNGKEVQFEIEWPSPRIGLISLHPIFKGREVVEVIGTVVDITDKKSMEKTLEVSESKYRLIAENTSDLIMVMDKEHSIAYFSPSHEVVLGYQCYDLENIELCKFIHSDDVNIFRNTIRKLFENKESDSIEYRFKHKEGHWIEFESRCMPVMGEKHCIEHIVIISRDISERKKAEGFLLQSEKLSIVGELAAGVAHEIRNPLTTIKGFVQLYKQEGSSIVYTDLLLSELERIETITSELLSLGKPQALQLNRTNLRELLKNTLELLTPQAHMNDIQFKSKFEESPFFITCEKNQIKQVFLNILKNALEAMPDGGDIHINLQKSEEDECVISFQDQGCGIPEELIPRLGEPFYSLKEKGTGLGLMICHKIIKQHQGSITYQSKVKEGTSIEIKLPLTD
jgi:PAS domain S-box-containing protein